MTADFINISGIFADKIHQVSRMHKSLVDSKDLMCQGHEQQWMISRNKIY